MSAEAAFIPKRKARPRSTTRRPQPRGDQSRLRLLAALEEQLRLHPFVDVSVADVAHAAGLKRPAFYFYFAGKHEAVTELLAQLFNDEIATVSEILTRDGDARNNVADALAYDYQSWHKHRLLFRAMLDARDADSDAREIWDLWLRRYERFLCDYIVANRSIEIPDAQLLAHALISMNERVLDRHIRSDDGPEAAAGLRAAVVHVWNAAIFGTSNS